MATPGRTVGPSRECGLASVLVVSALTEDHIAVEGALNGAAWQICVARDFREAVDVLDAKDVTSVICDADLPAGGWRELLRIVNESTNRPSFVLASNCADENAWAEVLNLGGYDLLLKPFDASEIDRVLAGARAEASRHCDRP